MSNANSAVPPSGPGVNQTRGDRTRTGGLWPLYGLYAWILLFGLGTAALLPLLLLPRLDQRRALIRSLARLILRLTGIRLDQRGLATLPARCIVVANHTSYLDGVLLTAALPPHFSFVIKREMSAVPLAGTLLRRIGAEFVERGDRQRGARDTRRLLRNAASGHALVFFPEGTFSSEVGLLRFHIGAFVAAVRAATSVIPVAIHGARWCLPPESPWPRPGTVRVESLAPLAAAPAADERRAADRATALRDAARAALLAVLGEPDLAPTSAASVPVDA